MSLEEQWKYERAYELDNYRMGPVRFNYASRDVSSFEAGRTYLDVGCGRGEMLDIAESNGVIVKGIETVPPLCDGERIIHGDACALPFANDTFDYLTCYDVLEHLPPGTEQAALDEFRRVCRGVCFFSTNDRPSHLPDGTDLHVNKRPQADWHADILLRWPSAEFDYAGRTRDWHWRCPR